MADSDPHIQPGFDGIVGPVILAEATDGRMVRVVAPGFVALSGSGQPAGSTSNPSYVSGISSVPLGDQQILAATLAASTALTVPTGALYAIIQCEAGVVRWRDFGVAPTASVGERILADGELFYDGNLAAIRFIMASGAPILNISYYR